MCLGQVEISSSSESRKTKFRASSRSRIISTPTKDSTTSKVQKSFQAKSFILSTPRPDDITVVKGRKNVRLQIKKKEGLGEKPREATK